MDFKKIINNFKFKKTFLSKGIDYNNAIINAFFDKYIFHHKIINWQNGFPIYTSMVPAMFSQASANLMGNSFFSSMFNKQVPFYVNLALTDLCNAKCPHCSFYSEDGIFDENKSCLKKEDFVKVINDLQEMGVSMIGFVGGEPLMNPDFEHILKSINKEKTSTLLFTNGYFLEENLEMLNRNGLNSIAISIDHFDLEIHEKLRGVEGLKNKILNVLKKVKKYNFTLSMSTYINEENIGDFPKYMDLAKKLGFHEVILFPSFPSGRLSKSKLYENKTKFESFKKTIKLYNENLDYPGIYWYSYVSSRESIGCQGGEKYLYISPYGDVMHCDFHAKSYGNILQKDIKDIFYTKDSQCLLISPSITKESILESKKIFNY